MSEVDLNLHQSIYQMQTPTGQYRRNLVSACLTIGERTERMKGRGIVRKQAVAHRAGWSRFEIVCPECRRIHVLTQHRPDVLRDDYETAFRLFDNGQEVQLKPDWVCRNLKCSFEGPCVMAPAK